MTHHQTERPSEPTQRLFLAHFDFKTGGGELFAQCDLGGNGWRCRLITEPQGAVQFPPELPAATIIPALIAALARNDPST